MAVPFEYHGQIIGQKGAAIRQLMEECDVNISIPSPSDKKNEIKITGTAEKIEKAQKVLEEKVQQIEGERKQRVGS